MPKDYEAMRDEFHKEKVDSWNRRHPHETMSKATSKQLYDKAQQKAARIHNWRDPEHPVTGNSK